MDRRRTTTEARGIAITGAVELLGLVLLRQGGVDDQPALWVIGTLLLVIAVAAQIGLVIRWRRSTRDIPGGSRSLDDAGETLVQPNARTRIAVTNEKAWFGNQRMGAYVVYLDGKRAGLVVPQDTWAAPVTPGVHTLRIRRRYYLSPKVVLEVAEGKTSLYKADITTMGRMMFTPWRALSLSKLS